jgi:hypothetical protein
MSSVTTLMTSHNTAGITQLMGGPHAPTMWKEISFLMATQEMQRDLTL